MDSGAVIIDLTPYESDVEDSGAALDWFVIGLDPQIATVTGQNSSVDALTFHPQGIGSDTFQLVLVDSDGGTDVITITLSVGPSLIFILSIVIPLVVVGAMVAFYFIYWRRRKPAKKTAIKRKKLKSAAGKPAQLNAPSLKRKCLISQLNGAVITIPKIHNPLILILPCWIT